MTLSSDAMDVLCPMHLRLGADGVILHAAPTLRKLFDGQGPEGQRFLDHFHVTRPTGITTAQDLQDLSGRTLRLTLASCSNTTLKGTCVPTDTPEGVVINLSFGIAVQEAVEAHNLTHADFAPTDLTIEMLYLIEAKSAAMQATRKLNERLQDARLAAEQLALTDPLTGLANRRGLELFLDRLADREAQFVLMHIDLDYFKQVNDTLGHDAGDFVLSEVARILRHETRDRDLVARVGGDEFVMIFDSAFAPDLVDQIARRLIGRVSEPMHYNGQECRLSLSIGTVFSADYAEFDRADLLSDADIALYKAKKAGRGRHRFFDASHAQATRASG